jgi:hypothetical protein
MLSKNCVSERVMAGESASDTFGVQPIRSERGQLCPRESMNNPIRSLSLGFSTRGHGCPRSKARFGRASVQRQRFELRQFMFHQDVVLHLELVVKQYLQSLHGWIAPGIFASLDVEPQHHILPLALESSGRRFTEDGPQVVFSVDAFFDKGD